MEEDNPWTPQRRHSVSIPTSSYNIYYHLIETEYLQSLGQTAYRCKEHPDIWDTSLKGLEISHFEPFHTDKQAEER
jgi:hypothetical protein